MIEGFPPKSLSFPYDCSIGTMPTSFSVPHVTKFHRGVRCNPILGSYVQAKAALYDVPSSPSLPFLPHTSLHFTFMTL